MAFFLLAGVTAYFRTYEMIRVGLGGHGMDIHCFGRRTAIGWMPSQREIPLWETEV